MIAPGFIRRLGADRRGTMAIETAIVAPVLLLMALGTFEVSSLVARQNELQSAAGEGEAIALTFATGAGSDVAKIKAILMTSVGLAGNQLTVTREFRCGTAANLVTAASSCSATDNVSTYLKIRIVDQYDPVWTNFGVGAPVNMNVTRMVQVS